MMRLAVLCLIMILAVVFSAFGHDLEFTMQRHHEDESDDGHCAEVSCKYGRDGVNVTKIRMSKIKAVGKIGRTLAELTADNPSVNEEHEEYEVIGVLSSGILGGKIEVHLRSPSDCERGLFSCDVTYDDESGKDKTDVAIMGPHIREDSTEDLAQPVTPSAAEICLRLEADFSEKAFRMEKSFDYKLDRLEQMCLSRDDHVTSRLTNVEQTMSTRLSGVESRFDGKYTRLDKQNSDLAEQVRQMEKNLSEDVTTCMSQYAQLQKQLTAINNIEGGSKISLSELQNEIKDVEEVLTTPRLGECNPGMGDNVTKNYRPYEIIHRKGDDRPILCDTHTDGGGWIVIQRRAKGDVDFYRDWTEYRNGFGSVEGDFWIGNERIHQLTSEKAYELRVDLRYQGREAFAAYASFIMDSEKDLYKLRLNGYFGNAGNNLHNNQAFSTFDRDHDTSAPTNCAVTYHGAWWYTSCHDSNLNGQWRATENRGPRWTGFSGTNPVSFSEMKIRRVLKPMIG